MKRILTRVRLSLIFVIVASVNAMAQNPSTENKPAPPAPQATEATVKANPKDVESIDAILASLYDVISGPAGKKRDWDRLRSLFVAGARLIPTGVRQGGEAGSQVLDVDGYITRGSKFFETNGFFEKEIARRTEKFGHIAHVFSTYESRHKEEDATPFQRGINSIQLMNDGKRWWVVTIFWEAERADNPIPKEYLNTVKN